MRVLVTGGAGFIGSHSVEALLRAGHQVEVLDNLSSGKRENLPQGLQLHELDLRDPELGSCLGAGQYEAVLHLAAQMDVRRSVDDPAFDADVNVRGSLLLLEACRRAGVKRFVFASSGGAIYGEQEGFPAAEDHPQRPVSPYGCAKASVERYLYYYQVVHGLSCLALRYANVYGPRQDPAGEAGVVAIFGSRLLQGEPCTVYGEGSPTRDYVYVGDVARANLSALESDRLGAINVGTGVETSTLALYEKIAALAGAKGAPLLAPGRPGEQLRSCIDPALASAALAWIPTVSLQEGLRESVEALKRR